MKGHRLILCFSVCCLVFSMFIGLAILLTPKIYADTSNFMFIFLFVGMLGVYTGITLKEYDGRIKNLERETTKEK